VNLTDDDLLRTDAAAAVCGYRPDTLAEWRRRGYGPAYVRSESGGIRYRRADLDAWLAACTVSPTPKDRP
jgi:hypothetical protein